MHIKEIKLSSVGLSREEWGVVESAAKSNCTTEEETILIPDPRFTHTALLEDITFDCVSVAHSTPSEQAFLILLATILEGNPTGPAELYLDPTLSDPEPTTNREAERTITLVYQTEFDLTDSLKEILKDEGRDILTTSKEELEEMAVGQVEDYDFNKKAGLAMTVTIEDN